MGDTPCVMKGAEVRYNGRFTRVKWVFGFVSTNLVILFLIIWFYRDDITNINWNFIILFFTRQPPIFIVFTFSHLAWLKNQIFSIFATFWIWGFPYHFFCRYYVNIMKLTVLIFPSPTYLLKPNFLKFCRHDSENVIHVSWNCICFLKHHFHIVLLCIISPSHRLYHSLCLFDPGTCIYSPSHRLYHSVCSYDHGTPTSP